MGNSEKDEEEKWRQRKQPRHVWEKQRTTGSALPVVTNYFKLEMIPDGQRLDRQGAQKELDDIVQCIIKYFYQPEKFGFTPRST